MYEEEIIKLSGRLDYWENELHKAVSDERKNYVMDKLNSVRKLIAKFKNEDNLITEAKKAEVLDELVELYKGTKDLTKFAWQAEDILSDYIREWSE